jgi:2-polyprenyl-6-methoxyphenol hydroxylase-like FAD-dependent oxidoreductase
MIDVLVAGAGPVGSTLAADLVRRGLSVRLIDQAPQSFEGSRAKGVQPRTQEVFEDLGILDEALAEGGDYPLMGIHLGPLTLPWRMQRRHRPTAAVPYPNILLLPQSRTDAVLHRLLERLGQNIEFGTTLDCFVQDDDGVTTTLASGELVHSRYLVGADGGGSTVRKAAGIRFAGETDQSDRTLIVDASIDGLSRNRWHVWPGMGGAFVGACPLPHSDQFQLMIKLKPEETPNVDEAALSDRFHARTGLRLRDVTWTSVFRPNVRIVEQYRVGRVFVAGDAAHVHTPAGAQGLNTGVQDAYNLGWKLGQVIAGAPEALLDSYELERRPVAAQVLGRSSELYAGIEKNSLASMKRGDEERQLGLSYSGGPLAPTTAPATRTLRVGDRAPDAPYDGSRGQRLFGAFQGPHFTLLAFGSGAAEVSPHLTWPTGGAALQRLAISDAAPAAETYGITGDALVLIRPDGYIASIITGDWEPAFAAAALQLGVVVPM